MESASAENMTLTILFYSLWIDVFNQCCVSLYICMWHVWIVHFCCNAGLPTAGKYRESSRLSHENYRGSSWDFRGSQENVPTVAETCCKDEPVIMCVGEWVGVCLSVCVCVCAVHAFCPCGRKNNLEHYQSKKNNNKKTIVIRHKVLQLHQDIMLWNSVQRSQRRMQLPELKAQRQPTLIIKFALKRFNNFFRTRHGLRRSRFSCVQPAE